MPGRLVPKEAQKAAIQVDLAERLKVEREALDEEVHGLDFLVRSARRICGPANFFAFLPRGL